MFSTQSPISVHPSFRCAASILCIIHSDQSKHGKEDKIITIIRKCGAIRRHDFCRKSLGRQEARYIGPHGSSLTLKGAILQAVMGYKLISSIIVVLCLVAFCTSAFSGPLDQITNSKLRDYTKAELKLGSPSVKVTSSSTNSCLWAWYCLLKTPKAFGMNGSFLGGIP